MFKWFTKWTTIHTITTIFQVQYFFSIKFLSKKNPASLPSPQPFLKVNWLFPLQQTSSSIEEDYNMKKLKMTNDNCYKKKSPSPLIWPGEKYQMNLMLSAGNHLFFSRHMDKEATTLYILILYTKMYIVYPLTKFSNFWESLNKQKLKKNRCQLKIIFFKHLSTLKNKKNKIKTRCVGTTRMAPPWIFRRLANVSLFFNSLSNRLRMINEFQI